MVDGEPKRGWSALINALKLCNLLPWPKSEILSFFWA
jgi:hypothetical protein